MARPHNNNINQSAENMMPMASLRNMVGEGEGLTVARSPHKVPEDRYCLYTKITH